MKREHSALLCGRLLRMLAGWLFVTLIVAAFPMTAASETLWQIGAFDHSSAEFAQGGMGRRQ